MQILKAGMRRGRLSLPPDGYEAVCEALDRGDLVAYPTETLYGLGGNPLDDRAVDRVYRAKHRPRDQPIALALAAPDEVWTYGHPTPLARAFCAKHLPGPVTVLLKATVKSPTAMRSTDGRIGIRVPDHPIAQAIAKAFGPITTTSANLHGGGPAATCEAAIGQLGDAVALYVDAGPCRFGRESTIVDLTGDEVLVVREGALPREAF